MRRSHNCPCRQQSGLLQRDILRAFQETMTLDLLYLLYYKIEVRQGDIFYVIEFHNRIVMSNEHTTP